MNQLAVVARINRFSAYGDDSAFAFFQRLMSVDGSTLIPEQQWKRSQKEHKSNQRLGRLFLQARSP